MSRVEDEVCEMIQQRAKVGLNKYGVTMEREDLTHDEWLEHLQHELMDAIVYIQRLRTREESIIQKLQRLINEPEPVSDKTEQYYRSFDTMANYRKQLADYRKQSEQVDMESKKEYRLAIFRGLMCDGKLKRHSLWPVIDREVKEKGSSHTFVRKRDLIDAYPKSIAKAYQHFNSVKEHFDTHREGRKVYVRLKEDFVDTLSNYRKQISKDTKAAMKKKKAEGKVFTGEIFGWDRDGDDMVPNWKEQDTIDYMRFRYYEQGWSGNKIAKHFNKLELKGKRGGAWTSSMVLRTCRYNYHANRIKFSHPHWWGSEEYHDAVEFEKEDD